MSFWIPYLKVPKYIIELDAFRISTQIIRWDKWSCVHLLGVFYLTIIFDQIAWLRWPWLWDLTYHYAPLHAYVYAFLWELGDGLKPLWIEWNEMKPRWIARPIWNLGAHILAADGFSLHDMLLPNLIGAILGVFILLLYGMVNGLLYGVVGVTVVVLILRHHY